MPYLLAILLIPVSILSPGCYGFSIPDDARFIRPFAPIGRWAGHWGVDVASPAGSGVPAAGSGIVRFAGTVVENLSVSIDHGGGVVTSYSYLDRVAVSKGDRIVRGQRVGFSGIHDSAEAYHMSLRLDGRYVDPQVLRRCLSAPSKGLYLAPRATTYAVGRARNPWRHIRSAPQRSSRHGQDSAEPARAGLRSSHACR